MATKSETYQVQHNAIPAWSFMTIVMPARISCCRGIVLAVKRLFGISSLTERRHCTTPPFGNQRDVTTSTKHASEKPSSFVLDSDKVWRLGRKMDEKEKWLWSLSNKPMPMSGTPNLSSESERLLKDVTVLKKDRNSSSGVGRLDHVRDVSVQDEREINDCNGAISSSTREVFLENIVSEVSLGRVKLSIM